MAKRYEQYPRVTRLINEQVLPVLDNPSMLLYFVNEALVPIYEGNYHDGTIYGGAIPEAMQALGVENYTPEDVIDIALLQSVHNLLITEHNMVGRLPFVKEYLNAPVNLTSENK